ncbi:Phage head-tail joining protein [Caballeronia pedi]|uniref:Phage head-tail joining protein n=1 Tax=Caballeronia pedi TaxID=1777141 RepID=A0A158BHH9_9BURK|nr:Phage head-tail joining protein [Caballeronia pedi]
MEAGRLNSRVFIERRVMDPDAESITWEPVVDRKAYVRMLSGKEVIAADAPLSAVKASVRIRYRRALCTILRPGMRAKVDDMVMRIETVQPDLVNREHIDLVCVIDER